MRLAFLFFFCKAPGTIKSINRFSQSLQSTINCTPEARLRSKPEQLNRMLASNPFCHLVLPMPLVHHWSQAAMNDPQPSTGAGQWGRRKGNNYTKMQSGAAMPSSPPRKAPPGKLCTATGAKTGSTGSSKPDDDVWREKSAGKSSRTKARMAKHM